MAEKIRVKRGDTFILACTTSLPITGWTIRSQVRSGDTPVAELDVAITQTTPTGAYTLRHNDTTQWPTTTLQCLSLIHI